MNKGLGLLTILGLIASCTPTGTSDKGARKNATESVSFSTNDPSTVSEGYGRILPDNPIILGGESFSAGKSLSTIMPETQYFITDNNQLTYDCELGVYSRENCLNVRKDSNETSPLTSSNSKWAYSPDSKEFLMVHTYWHAKSATSYFLEAIDEYTDDTDLEADSIPVQDADAVGISLSSNIGHGLSSNEFWPWSNTSPMLSLNIYTHCNDPLAVGGYDWDGDGYYESGNAFYDPATFSICLGSDIRYPGFFWAQDPTIIYHELGHTFIHSMLNLRNYSHPDIPADHYVTMGRFGYDEARAIGEGISDFMSYAMNGRTHVFEWAADKFYQAGRPLKEDDGAHHDHVSTVESDRVRYPEFLNYNPNDKTNGRYGSEDVHGAGMIASHYFVSLSEMFEDECNLDQKDASKRVIQLIADTLTELGDMTGYGRRASSDRAFTNLGGYDSSLRPTAALELLNINNPINFRKFFQVFARKMYTTYVINGNCGGQISQYEIEELLSWYGLLMFKNYNINGQTDTEDNVGAVTTNPGLRQNALTYAKSSLVLENATGLGPYYIVDKKSDILGLLSSLNNYIIRSPNLPSSELTNNGDGIPTKGEVVGIILNVKNNLGVGSLGGVQILANDWDHTKRTYDGVNSEYVDKPCSIGGFPDVALGGIASEGDADSIGNCDYVTRVNGESHSDSDSEDTDGDTDDGNDEDHVAPVCLLYDSSQSPAKWVTQSEYFNNKNGIHKKSDCLSWDPVTGEADLNQCYVRVIPGADQAMFSKLMPGESTTDYAIRTAGGKTFGAHHMVLMEISKLAPESYSASTNKLKCRFRARFTNCSDCWEKPTNKNDNYEDWQFSGSTPFRVFDVEIPINR